VSVEPRWNAPLSGAPHFTLAELTASDTARRYGLDNRPGPQAAARLGELARRVLEPLRRRFGPLAVTSGFRSAELNWFVSLARTSRHCTGEAADLKPLSRGADLKAMAAYAWRRLPVREVIVEHPPGGWLHVSLGRPGEAARLLLQEPGRPLERVTLEELALTGR